MTTRRLAERIEYSQPVLYSHFRGKDEIVAAVALEGFVALTVAVGRAIPVDAGPRAALAAMAATYLEFAESHPAVYDAMFSLSSGLAFADEATPAPLHAAFTALLDTLGPLSGAVEPELFTEVGWAALHGLVTLTRAGRLPAQHTARRLEVLCDRILDGTPRRPARRSR